MTLFGIFSLPKKGGASEPVTTGEVAWAETGKRLSIIWAVGIKTGLNTHLLRFPIPLTVVDSLVYGPHPTTCPPCHSQLSLGGASLIEASRCAFFNLRSYLTTGAGAASTRRGRVQFRKRNRGEIGPPFLRPPLLPSAAAAAEAIRVRQPARAADL